MGRSKTSSWVLGTAFLSIMVAVAAWFLGIGPTLDSAAEKQMQAESEQARIDQLEIQLAGLVADFENLDEFRAALEALRVQLPTEIELANFARQITDVSEQAGIAVISLSPGNPLNLAGPVAPVPAPVEGEADEAGSTDGDSTEEAAPAVPAGPSVPPGFYAVPFDVTLLGGYLQTVDFLRILQESSPRLVLVTALAVTGQDEAGAQSGRPATAKGDAETIISGYFFVLADLQAGAPVDGDAEGGTADEPSELPTPSNDSNPFAPTL